MTRRTAAAGLALLAALALAACDSIPDSGPVREGLESLDQGERGVLFNPSGPIAGADQESIVRGFIRAASSSTNDYEVAREFLAPTYADQWDPTLGVLIDQGAQQYSSPKEGLAVLSLNVVAYVEEDGSMTPAEPGYQTNVQFELTEVNGEWRISSAPAGIILDENTFSQVWATKQIYFVSADQRLVPEIRWFLNRTATQTTQIVRELLNGPDEEMAQALHTAFPSGTTLTSSAVPVVEGVAQIDLSAELFDADETAMGMLKRQLAASLQSVVGVSAFQLMVNGTSLTDGESPVAEDSSGSERHSVTIIKDGELSIATGGTAKVIEGLSEQVVELQPKAMTMAADRSAAAVLNNAGTIWVGEEGIAGIDSRSGQLTPGLDPLGYVWTYSTESPTVVLVTAPGASTVTLEAPWLEGREVVALRVSSGGNRVAALIDSGGQSEVVVAGVIRSEAGAPVGLTDTATTQMWVEGDPLDLAWMGDLRFATLTETGLLGGSGKVTTGEVGGRFAKDAGAVSGGVELSGGSSQSVLRVLDDQHRLFSPQGSAGWQQLMTDVELLAKAG